MLMRTNYFAIFEKLRREGKRVFTTNDISILTGKPRNYISLILTKNEALKRVERGLYCLDDADIYEIASNLIIPSYVGLFAALRYYDVTTQIPIVVSVIALKKHRAVTFGGSKILFTIFRLNNFFGYRKVGNASISSLEKTF
ncbi:transcriptional regulator, partial [mine drainage metagenome]